MEEVVFFDYSGAKLFLSMSEFEIGVNSLIENERVELKSNPNLSSITIDEDLVEFDSIKIPRSAVFVFYPWRRAMIITHGKSVFNSLKYTRNNYKIESNEQDNLLSKTIGIVGLSVGCSIVKAIVMEGLCGRIKIADFDTLDISNTNRIDWGVFDIGKPKVDLVYRWIKESNPFIHVDVFEGGINADNIDDFFGSSEDKLHVVVDECDSLRTKINLRRYAKKSLIPLVMHTSDRGMLDIENYNLENEYNSFLFQFDDYSDDELRSNAGKIIAEFCELKTASKRSVYSFMEIGKSISSWPQLAEDVVSGAGNVSSVLRRLLLGETLLSQRAYINCENLKTL